MNNFKKLTIVGTIVLSSLVATSVFAANTAKVTAETARMRSKASTDSSIVQLISMNEEVTIIEKSGEWYKIKYKGQTGYISSSLLDVDGNNKASTKNTASADTATTTNENSSKTVTENTTNTEEKTTEQTTTVEENKKTTIVKEGHKGKLKSKVDLRILPLINSSKILVLSENLDIEIVEVVNNWCSVKTSNSYGWVLKSNLETALGETTVQETATTEETKDNTEKEETKQETTENKEEATKTEETSKKEETTNTTKTGYINVDTVNVRKEKSTTSEILTNANKNVAVQILGEEDNWTKVKINGITGYIASKYISDSRVEVTSRGTEDTRQPATDTTSQATTPNTQDTSTTATTTQPTTSQTTSDTATTTPSVTSNKQAAKTKTNTNTNTSTSTSKSTSSGNGDAVVAYAKQYLGSKYVSGGSSPSTGFDCSGFTSYVYKHFGKSISRTSSGQRSNGTQVNKSDLQKGDIVCFTGHVGIYIGDNKFIHAANPRKGVVITSLSDSYYVKNYITARRIK